MQQNTSKQNYYQEDEIDLKKLIKTLADRKKFIFKFTSAVTILAILYALLATPTYQVNISFLAPDNNSIALLNKTKLTKFTKQGVYKEFLNSFSSRKFQKEVFNSKDYLSKFNINNDPIDNLDTFFAEEVIESFHQSIAKINKNEKKLVNELPVSFSLEGSNASTTSNYLNDIAAQANHDTIKKLLQQTQQKIDIRLEEIVREKSLLLKKGKSDRLSKISTIEEADQQKINEITDQIARIRTKTKRGRLDKIIRIEEINQQKVNEINYKIDRLRVAALQSRLNKVKILSDAVIIANDLGIVDNNFKETNDNQTLSVSIGDNQKLPKWYLYGKNALSKEINILKNRKSDDPYIPEIISLQNQIKLIKTDQELFSLKNRKSDDPYITKLVDLQNQLKKVRSNQLLKTLRNRKDDSPFIAKLNILDNESIKLKSFILDATDTNAMQLHQASFQPKEPIKPKKILIVIVTFIAGFILSIFLVFIMNAFRNEDEKAIA